MSATELRPKRKRPVFTGRELSIRLTHRRGDGIGPAALGYGGLGG
jgi:hypothetical protein